MYRKAIVSDQPQALYRATAKNQGKRPRGICSKLIAEIKIAETCRDGFLVNSASVLLQARGIARNQMLG